MGYNWAQIIMKKIIEIREKGGGFFLFRLGDASLALCSTADSAVETIQEIASERRKVVNISWWYPIIKKDENDNRKPSVKDDLNGLKRAIKKELSAEKPKVIRVTAVFTPTGETSKNSEDYYLVIREVK